MPDHLLFAAAGVVLAASVLLGGGARGGLLSDAILELVALPALLLAAWRWLDLPRERRPRFVLPFLVAVGAFFLLQLAPLPPALWTALPQRETLIDTFQLIGRAPPWMAMSVDPHLTRASLLAAIPPLAVFLGASCLRREQRRLLLLLLAPLAAASVTLGLLQLAQGPDSLLRFYRPTNPSEAVGFFANRNHFAALLYCVLVVAGAWTIDCARAAGGARALVADMPRFVAALAGATTFVIMLAGEAMARSRAGLALSLLAIAGVFVLARGGRSRTPDAFAARRNLWLGAGALALGLALIPLHRAVDRFTVDHLLEDARWTIARRAFDAALAFLPFGSGLGSFVPVYAGREQPQDLLPNVYVNHAHDDFLELFLESGAPGAALVLAFLVWWGWKSARLWRSAEAAPGAAGDLYARAAAMIVGLLLLHSLVDYPLRSAAMMSVFALACAWLAAPEEPVHAPAAPTPQAAARKRRPHARVAAPPVAPAPLRPSPGAPSPSGPLDDFEWPDQWKGS